MLRKISISHQFSLPNETYTGRLYVHAGLFKPSSHLPDFSPAIRLTTEVHEQSAELAAVDMDEDEVVEDYQPLVPLQLRTSVHSTESSLLLGAPSFPPVRKHQLVRSQVLGWFEHLTVKSFVDDVVVKPTLYLPAVGIGLLLNILDGLSYGMIMFPVSEAVFSKMAPSGLLMFYVLTVISQLVYSCGALAFGLAIGLEMIEITPFFHTMALGILADIGDDHPDEVLTTTIVAYALSSIVTGLVFFILGKLRLGALVSYFPRHTLISCVGGVGFFLVITGLEVSSRLEGGFTYSRETLQFLLHTPALFQWVLPAALTALLVVLQHRFHHHAAVLPAFFVSVFFLFHVVIMAVPSWSLESARSGGWVFDAPESLEPWYSFYELYRPGLIRWGAIVQQVPTMLALTFFGVLHVPINVPALAVLVGMDEFDVDRELVAHGLSNTLSGCVGAIQNYLVYTNLLLFIRAGADLRLAGIMLAAATAAVMCAGPAVIGYIPVCVVGLLIFLLGYELLVEALVDTWGRVKPLEYFSIVTVIIVMGTVDFVVGILVGILLACGSFVVGALRRSAVLAMYTGSVARLTVLRHPKQQEFLRRVGDQICVVKLQGQLFFGLIGLVEQAIRGRFELQTFRQHPVRFLIVDMAHVALVDFSGAEGFRRIRNLMAERSTQLCISLLSEDGDVVKALRDAGLWNTDDEYAIQLFGSLNLALEFCENSFLETYRQVRSRRMDPGRHLSISRPSPMTSFGDVLSLPRNHQVVRAATRTVREEQAAAPRSSAKQPIPLLVLAFQGYLSLAELFWSGIELAFVRELVPVHTRLYASAATNPCFYLLELGMVRCEYRTVMESGETLSSSILPLTAFGDVCAQLEDGVFVYYTDAPLVVWRLDQEGVRKLSTEQYTQLLVVQAKLTSERFQAVTGALVVSQ